MPQEGLEMTAPRFFSTLTMAITATIIVGFGSAYLENLKRNRMSDELAQWQLEEWKDNLKSERHREFEEQRNSQ